MLLVLAQASDSPSSPIFDRVAPWIQAGLLLLFLILMAGVVIWVLLQLARASKGPAGDAEPPSAPPSGTPDRPVVEAPLSDRVEPAPGPGLEPGRVVLAERHPSGADHLEAAAKARVSSEELEALRDRVQAELDDYELFESLGRGGMGAVFRARQVKLDREVAIKVLLPPPGEVEGWSERFQREAQALARLVHPGIVSVHDFGQGEDLAWIVMELVDGADLRQMLEEGRLPQAEALAIVPALCEALQYAHDQGVVHRDIKPENVLFDRFGGVKLVDFGLAKLSGDDGALQLTRTDQAMGTLRYMAPEQLERPREVDHRADLFSLGVIFYEMLTGHVPAGVVEPPSRIAGVDAGIDDVVLSALERDPGRRPQSAADIERQLKGVQDGEGARVARETPVDHGQSSVSEVDEMEAAPRPWSAPSLLRSFDWPDLVALLAFPVSVIAALVSRFEGDGIDRAMGRFDRGLRDFDATLSSTSAVPQDSVFIHQWAMAASLLLLAVPAFSILLWAFQRWTKAQPGPAPYRFLCYVPLIRVGVVSLFVCVSWGLGVLALRGAPRASTEVAVLVSLLLSTAFCQRGALQARWSRATRRTLLFGAWAAASTGGLTMLLVCLADDRGVGLESPVPLAPMLVLGVVSVLLYRAGRLHLATVAMGAAGALTLALRSALPTVYGTVFGLPSSGTRIMVGASLLAALMISVISAAGSAPRKRS